MRPDERELDDEIRGHLALSIQEHIDRGADPSTARQRALEELGYVGDVRASMRRVWYSRWFDASAALARDGRIAFRSLLRAKGLAAAVIVTLGLGIGANAAIFSVVRGVLLRPLVNRDEDRLVYIRQSAPGIDTENLTFSVPEVNDFKARIRTISSFGDFSTVSFTIFGLGAEPRVVRAGVVGGSYFDVMGLRPVLGRLLAPSDDGPQAAGAIVLTYRYWTTALNSDPSLIGKTVRVGPKPATIVGVLEPSVPYPAETEIIANVVTSPHHLSATMETSRIHRMTELFGRLAPGATLSQALAEISTVHAAMMREHPDAYSPRSHVQVSLTTLRDQIASPARTILLVLLAAAAVVFIIACSNVANLILARSVRREGELAIRAALGAGRGALRRTLLAESLVLCGAGALFGLAIAQPSVGLVARYAARFSVRALDLTVDPSVLLVSFGLAIAAAVLLAFIPRLPSGHNSSGVGLASGGRLTPATNRRLRTFAVAQIAFSFVLLAGAGMLVATLVSLQRADTVVDTRHVLAFDIPSSVAAIADAKTLAFYNQVTRRVAQLPSVAGVAIGSFVPWRDTSEAPRFEFAVAGYTPANGEPDPYASFRIVAPNYFAVLGVPILAGRDFTDADGARADLVCIISQNIAQRMFAGRQPLNHQLSWKHPITGASIPARIVGIAADVDDERVTGGPAMTLYVPVQQIGLGGRLFVHVNGEPHALIPAVRTIVRQLSSEQPVERAATLEEVRAQMLSPARVNAFVVSGFAGIALLIAVVGIGGVLAFSVSARTREFGVRLAVGSAPRQLLGRVLSEGVCIATAGVAAGAAGGYGLAKVAMNVFDQVQLPGVLTTMGAAVVLMAAASAAALLPAARAAHVDVVQALRSG